MFLSYANLRQVKGLLTKNSIIIALTLIIVTLAIIMVVKSGSSDDSNNSIEVHKLNQTISIKQKKIEQLKAQGDSLRISLSALKEDYKQLQGKKDEVRTKYRKVYVYIDHATNKQLDSLIRSNW